MQSAILHTGDTQINTEEWFGLYQNCVRHFLDVAQHSPLAQSLAAFLNILLPYQRVLEPVLRLTESTSRYRSKSNYGYMLRVSPGPVSLIPYIRRLVVTATDTPLTMRELFGDDWCAGIGQLHLQERMNYLFAAKSVGWLQTKAHYDLPPYETVPFLRPLRDPQEQELRVADVRWSEWLAMEDWMVGPRSPF
ncbi:hypothetical protein BGW36DRAFT_351120 [Talaromyces proteolyticus]|uniref:Uncharacterized protein n=1 Tax=Talaromyces proteolyticus TaxID=1131652 RepID=A0AAD4KIC7_9EURO|nr:uncharacterized protein BGW36DRAFT_351120 [Talaromyces proteolyticus]KAH8690050.1 hypothetical protein BGW36DRAFT_351120 [Talaromyces proteolyticus]